MRRRARDAGRGAPFNVEFRSSNSAVRTDGIRGYWDSLRSPDATVHELVDVDGLLTFVSMSGSGGSPSFRNLMNGSYEVTTYTGTGAARRIVEVAPLSYDAGSISQVGARDAEIERSAAACN